MCPASPNESSRTSPNRLAPAWWAPRLLALGIGTCLGLACLEIGLQIRNPFEFRVQHGRIVLPAHKTYRIQNSSIPRLDPVVLHTKNSLGFRGPEPPAAFDQAFTLITVGGSTTECFYLSDGKTWPDRLEARMKPSLPSLWMNNAGLDGHSTVGHLVLLRDVLVALKPKAILFLVGLNDALGYGGGPVEANTILGPVDLRSSKGLLKTLAMRSEVLGLAENLYRNLKAKRAGLGHVPVDFDQLRPRKVTEAERQSVLDRHRAHIAGYEDRLREIIRISRSNGIQPIFLTQPSLLGSAFSRVRDGTASVVDLSGTEQELTGQVLDLYNEATLQVAGQEGVASIDLAGQMPKDEALYYDWYHFTNQGAEAVAEAIAPGLLPILKNMSSPLVGED